MAVRNNPIKRDMHTARARPHSKLIMEKPFKNLGD